LFLSHFHWSLAVFSCFVHAFNVNRASASSVTLQQSSLLPDQKKKPSQDPTAHWVFQCFQGITIIYLEEHALWAIGRIGNRLLLTVWKKIQANLFLKQVRNIR